MAHVSVGIKIVTNGEVGENWQQKKKGFRHNDSYVNRFSF